jgi:hypothetical protein
MLAAEIGVPSGRSARRSAKRMSSACSTATAGVSPCMTRRTSSKRMRAGRVLPEALSPEPRTVIGMKPSPVMPSVLRLRRSLSMRMPHTSTLRHPWKKSDQQVESWIARSRRKTVPMR